MGKNLKLVADCNINRKTFYYHFEDIYALLKWMFEEEAIDVVKHFDLLVDYEEAIAGIFMDWVKIMIPRTARKQLNICQQS